MLILSFDVLSPYLSLAILQDDKVLCQKTLKEKSKHSELLICEIENLLNEVGIWYQDLDLVATTTTPGSFTSSRIALVVAKTIKLSLKAKVVLLDAMQVLAYKNHQSKQKNIIVVMDGAMGEYYVASYLLKNKDIEILQKTQIYKLEDLGKIFDENQSLQVLVCGNAKEIFLKKDQNLNIKKFCDGYDLIDAVDIARYGLLQSKVNQNSQKDQEISYLRKPRIEKRKK